MIMRTKHKKPFGGLSHIQEWHICHGNSSGIFCATETANKNKINLNVSYVYEHLYGIYRPLKKYRNYRKLKEFGLISFYDTFVQLDVQKVFVLDDVSQSCWYFFTDKIWELSEAGCSNSHSDLRKPATFIYILHLSH